MTFKAGFMTRTRLQTVKRIGQNKR